MSETPAEAICAACGALHFADATCQDDFYQMLYWESELMAESVDLMETHFLMVACYHLQHPHLYS